MSKEAMPENHHFFSTSSQFNSDCQKTFVDYTKTSNMVFTPSNKKVEIIILNTTGVSLSQISTLKKLALSSFLSSGVYNLPGRILSLISSMAPVHCTVLIESLTKIPDLQIRTIGYKTTKLELRKIFRTLTDQEPPTQMPLEPDSIGGILCTIFCLMGKPLNIDATQKFLMKRLTIMDNVYSLKSDMSSQVNFIFPPDKIRKIREFFLSYPEVCQLVITLCHTLSSSRDPEMKLIADCILTITKWNRLSAFKIVNEYMVRPMSSAVVTEDLIADFVHYRTAITSMRKFSFMSPYLGFTMSAVNLKNHGIDGTCFPNLYEVAKILGTEHYPNLKNLKTPIPTLSAEKIKKNVYIARAMIGQFSRSQVKKTVEKEFGSEVVYKANQYAEIYGKEYDKLIGGNDEEDKVVDQKTGPILSGGKNAAEVL